MTLSDTDYIAWLNEVCKTATEPFLTSRFGMVYPNAYKEATVSEVKKTATRTYVLHDKLTGDVVYVKATNPSVAINYATRDRYNIRVANFEDALRIKPEDILDSTRPGVHPDQQPLDGVPQA